MRSVISDTADDRGRRVRSWLSAGCVAGALVAGLVVGAAPGAAADALAAVDLVVLSGVVSDASGPVSGTSVSFGGGSQVSTVTGADGAYLLHVLPGDASDLEFVAGSATQAPLRDLRARASLAIGTNAVVANFAWPAHAQVRTTVVDAASSPIAGIQLSRGPGDDIHTTLSNGSAVTIDLSYPDSEETCTTDSAGQCTFSTLIGATPSFSATSQLVPGDPTYPTLTAYANPLITTDPTDATIAFSAADLVVLSGVVSDASGPVSGTSVSFGGGSQVSTVTGADGAYLLHVLPGDASDLEFVAGSATQAPLRDLRARASLAIGTNAVVANFAWPAHAQVRTTVVDAASSPIAGIQLSRGPGDDIHTTLSNGSAVTIDLSYPDSEETCTTDSAGQCTFSTLIGATPSFSATSQLVPGDPTYPTLTAYANPLITTDPTDATIAFSAADLVVLSGVVSDASGPVSGTSVSFGGGSQVSTVTGADGAYLLHVLPGDASDLEFVAGSATQAPLRDLRARASLAIGTNAVVANFAWPAHAQVRTTVVDAASSPIAGIQLSRGPGDDIHTTLSNGSAVTIDLSYPDSEETCTTDSAGQCTFSTLIGATPSFSATSQLVPGDPTYPTLTAYANPLITTDPTDATVTFVNLTSFVSAGSVSGAVVVGSSDGTVISNVSVEPVPVGALPAGAIALTGALAYQVNGLTPGGAVDVTLLLPAGSNPTGVYKLQNGVYADASSIATIAGNVIVLHLTDGGFGDADGTANGVIVDPVVPAGTAAQQLTSTVYLHGSGATANPHTLTLNTTAPIGSTERYTDSASVQFSGGNPWKTIGTWNAAPAAAGTTLTGLSDLHAWLGLKNSDDQGTQFDLRAELYRDNTLIAAGTTRCITGLTRNPSQATEALVAFGSISPTPIAASNVVKLKLLTRIGTNPNDTKCTGPGGSHASATGLRTYYDATTRPARFTKTTTTL